MEASGGSSASRAQVIDVLSNLAAIRIFISLEDISNERYHRQYRQRSNECSPTVASTAVNNIGEPVYRCALVATSQ